LSGVSGQEPAYPFDHPAVVQCERAVAEMRAGRPIILTEGDEAMAVLALDACTAAAYDRFCDTFPGPSQLYLAPARAMVLGIEAPQGALTPLAGLSFDQACELGYRRTETRPTIWSPAPGLAAAAARVARLGLLLPALVVVRVEPGRLHERPSILMLEAGDLDRGWQAAGRVFNLVARTRVPLKTVSGAEFVVFRGGLLQRDQVAVVVGAPDPLGAVPVRVHSACLTGDLFGSLKCDCGDQLRRSLSMLDSMGGGVLIYLDQEGRGSGLAAKMRAYGYQHEGLDTIDADAVLGFDADERVYEAAAAILDRLGYGKIRLLTNNPRKVALLQALGVDVVGRVPLLGGVTAENEGYLRTKAARAGHHIDLKRNGARSRLP
jgi:GTP cyclohydrolase II